jgi:hypothetical protein
MIELLQLILGAWASLFKSRVRLDAENLVLRYQVKCYAGRYRSDHNSKTSIVFCFTVADFHA